MKHFIIATLVAVATALVFAGSRAPAPGPAASRSCESLASLNLPNATITDARTVGAGGFRPPTPGGAAAPPAATQAFTNLPAFCRVAATLTPTSDSDIKIEVWLPVSGWNGKFQAVGNGGWAGTIPYPAMSAALSAGYATAGTDTGHAGNSADFALGHPEKLIDLAYRSIHEMTVESKTIISDLYGTPARLSYYNGCSQGGRQGLAAAQKYPDDFNAIVAGAAAWNSMAMHGARTMLNLIVNKDQDSVIPPSKYSMIHDAVLNACDASDGVKDGVIENPAKCHFDYVKLLCKAGDGADCLTKGQVESANAMISPIKDPKTGKVLYEGHLMPGSELGWATLGGPQPIGLAVSGLRNIVFQDRNWDYHTLNISSDIARAEKSDNGVMYSGDPNLKPFFDKGGKLLMYHGWSDPQVNPLNSVIYYNNVVKAVGSDKTANSIALFMMPGVNHCQGGPGTDTFNKVKVIEEWVEQGRTPPQIIAAHMTNGKADKTRPLCPYPQVAAYKGTGATDDATNFVCKKP
jgi:feruloyl esterase